MCLRGTVTEEEAIEANAVIVVANKQTMALARLEPGVYHGVRECM